MRNRPRQKGSITPASIPDATCAGMRAASRPSAGISPSTTIIAAAATNTPVATGHPAAVALAAISAAPGVDQASTTGIFCHQLRKMLPIAMPAHSAVTIDPICPAVPPSACPACTTSTTVPPKPMSAAIAAAAQPERGRAGVRREWLEGASCIMPL